MFNTIKKLFGVKTSTVDTEIPNNVKVKFANATPTTPLTIKPKVFKLEEKHRVDTPASLTKMTKVQIDDLAKEKFGVDLDRRKSKADMIDGFMSAQKKAK